MITLSRRQLFAFGVICFGLGVVALGNLTNNELYLWFFDPQRGAQYGDNTLSVALRWGTVEWVETVGLFAAGLLCLYAWGQLWAKPVLWMLNVVILALGATHSHIAHKADMRKVKRA